MTCDKFVNIIWILSYPILFVFLVLVFMIFNLVYFIYQFFIGSFVKAVMILAGKDDDLITYGRSLED
jgi:hypothetical protein